MKQFLILVIVVMSCSAFCAAQQPILDPNNVNRTGQKDIKPGQLKPLPAPLAKVSFSARITEPRSAVPLYEDGNVLARYNELQWNDGNGFNAATGVFTAPAQGLYCFIGNFSLGKYGCVGNAISWSLTFLKNGNQPVESFNLPVSAGDNEGATTESITLLVQLNLNDRITLRPAAVACTGGQVPMLRRAVFSGYKVY
jgi:C1q domain